MCVLNIRGPETQFSQVSLKAIGVLLVNFFRREVHEKKHTGLRKDGGRGGRMGAWTVCRFKRRLGEKEGRGGAFQGG